MTATVQETISLEQACEKLIEFDQVRHVAVINKLGKPIASSFKPGIKKFLDDSQLKMVYMQMMLDLKMRQELDELLGPIDYITSRRKNIAIICVPTEHYLVLISTDPLTSSRKIIKKAEELFDIIDLK